MANVNIEPPSTFKHQSKEQLVLPAGLRERTACYLHSAPTGAPARWGSVAS